jgi:DNA-binding PadR family transcriptional regulator
MDYYSITESGRQALPKLIKTNNFKQIEMLKYLDLAGRANIAQISYALHLAEQEAQKELKLFTANRWVRLDKSKTLPF